jgi:hypothetical protein
MTVLCLPNHKFGLLYPMIDTAILPANPFATLKDDAVCITLHKKTYTIAIEKLQKIHIRKSQSDYFNNLIGSLLDAKEMRYQLCIDTNDCEMRFQINALQRFYFIRLISLVRQRRNSN